MKQVSRVMDALTQFGPLMSDEIASVTGLSVNSVCAVLSGLADDGIIKREPTKRRFSGNRGRQYTYRWSIPA